MGDVVDIRPHLRLCENCRWHDGHGVCLRPGGWYFDSKYKDCATFERKKGIVHNENHQRTD